MNIDPVPQHAPYQVSPPRYSVSHQMATTAFELPNFRVTQNLGVVRGIVGHYEATGRLSRRLAA